MSNTFNQILAEADWKEITPRLLNFAESQIGHCVWRGLRVHVTTGAKVCVEGLSAEDFLQEAVDRLINGRRHYNHRVSLEQNLRGIIRSAIWSLNKSARRAALVDPAPKTNREEVPDLGNDYPGPSLSPAESAIRSEYQREQRRMLKILEESISDDAELLKLLNAFKDGHYTPRDVEDLTGIPSARVSELKRKLRERMEKFETQSREEMP